ncbi:MAG: homoprotocatechuate degradation operon regulator HpaR [Gemmobacter sp.]
MDNHPDFLPTDVRHSLPMALLRAREAVMARFRPMLDAHGVNEQQWRVLRVLAEQEELDASEVAARASILAPSLTRMARSMAERGLIARRRDDADARRVLLRLAPAGLAVLRAAAAESRSLYLALQAEYGQERMAALIEHLNALAALGPGDAKGP